MSGLTIVQGIFAIVVGLVLLLFPRRLAEYDIKARERKPWPRTPTVNRAFFLLRCGGVIAIALGVVLLVV